MDFRKLKGNALGLLTGTEQVDETLTSEEAHRIYLRIIRKVRSNLKDKGFVKKGDVNIYRIENEIIQILNFQKSAYEPRLTINTSIRPIFWYKTEGVYLLTCKRIGQFDAGFDKWYPIEREYLALTEYLTALIGEKVIPHFERCNSPKKVLQNIEILEEEERMGYDDLILFSALREGNYKISLRYIEKELDSLSRDNRDLKWVRRDKEFYSTMHDLVKQNNFSEINRRLDSFRDEFLKKNSNWLKSTKIFQINKPA